MSLRTNRRPAPAAASHPALRPGAKAAQRLSGPALRTFFRIAEAWQLSSEEARTLLGDPPRSTFFAWKKSGDAMLGRDTLERISYLLGIYKALQILLPEPAAADQWLRKPNAAPLFGGQPALARMLSGNVADLYVVRQYLDAWRGG
ncbi:MAG: MbcA/ParS/Xre antitoxin family protein [Casimicrobiaceae bacterium]